MSIGSDIVSGHTGDRAANTPPRYSLRNYRLPAKVFHWLTAALVFILILTGVTMKQLGDGEIANTLTSLHKATGILLLGVVVARIGYRLVRLEPGWRHHAHRHPFIHWALYGLLLLMPLLGWAGVSDFGAREVFPGFALPPIWPEGAGYHEMLLTAHAFIAFGLLALVALHIAVAMQDHLMRSRSERPEPDN
jgi:cytochrome b561